VINSAYGLQCSKISSEIVRADQLGIVDIIVSSTDKNFMVPVGGSILYNTA
jgi:O-phospho-L-seryl-tRNASec:L-selenocysteinyl-tRNA synthase